MQEEMELEHEEELYLQEKKLELQKQLNLIMGASALDQSTMSLTYYNTLKQMVNNCSVDVEIDATGLVKEKYVDLDKLYGFLHEASQSMKINFVVTKKMIRHQHIQIEDFAEIMRHLELNDQLFLPEFEERNLHILQNVSLVNPRRIIT